MSINRRYLTIYRKKKKKKSCTTHESVNPNLLAPCMHNSYINIVNKGLKNQ